MAKVARNLLTFLSLTVAPITAFGASQTIAFDAIPNQIFGVSPFMIVAQASSGLPVSFVSTTPGVCKLSGSLVMLLSVGPCFIMASQAGNGSYSAASPVTQNFTVVQAKPAGTLTAAMGSPFAAGNLPGAIVTADFNGDGIPDIAALNLRYGQITVLLGNGSGGFTAAPGSPLETPVTAILGGGIATGDFSGDGIPDLVVSLSDRVVVYLGNGSGGFTFASFFGMYTPGVPVVGDFNDDGIQDVAVACNGQQSDSGFTDAMVILLGDGTGQFSAPISDQIIFPKVNDGYVTFSLAVGDFNGDGIQDLVAVDSVHTSLTVMLGNGSGGFTPIPGGPFIFDSPINFVDRPANAAIVVGDFNGDGIQDVATSYYSSSVAVLLGNGMGGFTPATGSPFLGTNWSTGPNALAEADFNGDGIPDLVVGGYFGGYVTVLLGNGSGGFTVASPFPTGFGATSIVAADFNGDGIEDVAGAEETSNDMAILFGGQASSASMLTAAPTSGVAPGATLRLVLTVSDTTAAFNQPTGTATFYDGSTLLGTSNQNASPFAFTISNLTSGSHTLTATYGSDSRTAGSTSNSLLIRVELPQTITFGPLPNVAVGTTAFTLSATATSGDAVSFASGTPVVCSVSGNIVTILASGGCSITASQAGDANYAAAVPVTQKFTVFFSDVAPGDNDYAAINAMAQHGITSGCASNGFCPNANVTRDEMAIFIVRAIYGNDNFTYSTTPYFTDVTSGTFGFKWIQKLRDLGITGGCTATTYCPGEVVTRDQMAVLIIRARLGVSIAGPGPTFTYPSTPYFTDATAESEFAFPWIQRMKMDGITSGCTATTYCSTDPVTRGEMAIFIMRGAFNQFLPVGTPVISQISPATLPLGTSETVTVTGVNTNFVQGTTVISPIPGVTIGTVTVTSPTSLMVQLTAASNAVAQPYSILAITGSEQDVLPNGLVLQ